MLEEKEIKCTDNAIFNRINLFKPLGPRVRHITVHARSIVMMNKQINHFDKYIKKFSVSKPAS